MPRADIVDELQGVPFPVPPWRVGLRRFRRIRLLTNHPTPNPDLRPRPHTPPDHRTPRREPAHRDAHPPVRRAAQGGRRHPGAPLRLGGQAARARRASGVRRPARPHRHRAMRHRPRHRRALRVGHRRQRHGARATRGHGQPRHRHRRGGDRRLHGRGPERGRAPALLRRRPGRGRRTGPAQVPLRGPPPVPHAEEPAAAVPGERRYQVGHGPPGLRRDRDAAALGPDARGVAGVLRAGAPAPRLLLRTAPEPPAGQAAAHGGRFRPLLPDRSLPKGRGPAGRPPVRVHAARPRVLVRQPGRRHGVRLRGRARCGRSRHGRATPADRAHDLGGRARPLRHRQAGPALRHGADRTVRRVRGDGGEGLLVAHRQGAPHRGRRRLPALETGRADRAGEAGRRHRAGLVGLPA